MSYLYRKHKNGGSACSVWYTITYINVDSSINVFINEPFEMNMLCNGSTKMKEARVLLGHTFMSYVAEARKWRKRV